MYRSSFQFGHARLRSMFSPRKPRHPLLRLLLGLVGVAMLGVLIVLGLFVGAAMLAGGLLYKLLRQRGQPIAQDPRVVEGEFRVVDKPALPLSR
ncbi:hypothetical protein CSC70_05360 [Pseudoxanthomonas kalamensis DSM 18571]|uniref:hypothetical protein n=1 Tax=Pseudoxanthomonas kalamensis TaxID=289483 RepID=UPI0013912D82|nr:hypothetical protein [Pseudoxanthomonas kalamensis]KAF1711338.1 hypothetical protein CSC70_05360 [Pseudoxanthomonas kalamensis DSM 18571]